MFYKWRMNRQLKKKKYNTDMCIDLYSTILEILPQMLETMRQHKLGAPELKFEEIETFPKDWLVDEIEFLKKEKTQDDNPFDINSIFDRYDLVIRRIIFCFKQADASQTEIINEYAKEYNDIVWGPKEDDENLTFKQWWKKHTEIIKYDEKGKPKLYKFKTNVAPKELEEKWLKRNNEIEEYRDRMKDEAFDLLKKYFWDLWC